MGFLWVLKSAFEAMFIGFGTVSRFERRRGDKRLARSDGPGGAQGQQAAAGRPFQGLVPEGVAAYIRRHGLYRA